MKGDLEIYRLNPDEIVRDGLFSFSEHRREAVVRLIELTGFLLTPLWVRKEGTEYLLIDGYARIYWAERNNVSLPCIVFPETVPKSDLLIWKLFELLSRREPDVIEKARIVRALASFYTPAEIKERFFPILKIPRKPRMFKTMLLVAGLDREEVTAVSEGYISEKVLFKIVWWDDLSRARFIELLKALRCSVGVQRELVEFIDDIARLDGVSQADVINKQEVQEILRDQRTTPRDKTERLRRFLRYRLYPVLARREHNFRETMRKLSLHPDVSLKPPEFFEGDLWTLNIHFSDVDELENHVKSLLRGEILSGLRRAVEASDD